MNLMELDALIWCCYVCTHCVTEEGTRMARAECEDGAIYIVLGGRDPYGTGGVRRRCYIYRVGRKGPVWHGRSAKTVLYVVLGGRDLYGTGGVRRRCYDIHIIVSLHMIENERLW